jgi:hypothetical protein
MEERNMRNAKVSKIIAASMAATMLLTPATVLADDVTDSESASSSIGGDGSLEGYVNKDVFRVVLPTIQDVNFTLDPQGLLKKANSTKYTLGVGAVYFENAKADGSDSTYSATSDAITIYNKSSYDVEVGLSVTLDTGDIALAAKDDLADATDPSLYLGLIKDTDAAIAITDSSYESDSATVAAVPEADGTTITKGYEIQASQTAPTDNPDAVASPEGYYYSYGLTNGFADTDAEEITYKLEGACDSTADWSGIDTKAVTANVAWTITKAGEPSVSGSAYSRSNTANTYTLKNFTGKSISSIDASNDGKIIAAPIPTTAYTITDETDGTKTLKIDGTKAPFGTGAVGQNRYIILNLDDGSKFTICVKVSN